MNNTIKNGYPCVEVDELAFETSTHGYPFLIVLFIDNTIF
jgi:hypothetical protein